MSLRWAAARRRYLYIDASLSRRICLEAASRGHRGSTTSERHDTITASSNRLQDTHGNHACFSRFFVLASPLLHRCAALSKPPLFSLPLFDRLPPSLHTQTSTSFNSRSTHLWIKVRTRPRPPAVVAASGKMKFYHRPRRYHSLPSLLVVQGTESRGFLVCPIRRIHRQRQLSRSLKRQLSRSRAVSGILGVSKAALTQYVQRRPQASSGPQTFGPFPSRRDDRANNRTNIASHRNPKSSQGCT